MKTITVLSYRLILHWLSVFVIFVMMFPAHARLKPGEIVENNIDLGFGKITLSSGTWRVVDDWNLNSDRNWNILLLENTNKDAMLPLMDIRYIQHAGNWKETTCDRFKDDKFLYSTHNTKSSDFLNKCTRSFILGPSVDIVAKKEINNSWWGEVFQRLTQSGISIPSEVIVAENEIQKFNRQKVQINIFIRTDRLGATPSQIRNNRTVNWQNITKNLADWLHDFVEANALSLFDKKSQVIRSLASHMANREEIAANNSINAGSNNTGKNIKNGDIFKNNFELSSKSHLALPDGTWKAYLPKASSNSDASKSVVLLNTSSDAPIPALVYRDWSVKSPDPLSFPCKANTINYLGESKLNTDTFDYHKRCVSFYELGPNFSQWKLNSNSAASEWMHILRELPSLGNGDSEKLLLAELYLQQDGDQISLIQLLIRPTVLDQFGANSVDLFKNPASFNNFLAPWIEQFALGNQSAIFYGVSPVMPHFTEFSQNFSPSITQASSNADNKVHVAINVLRELVKPAELSRQTEELKQRQQVEENLRKAEAERQASETKAADESRRRELTRVSASTGNRKALIIGNDDYQSVPKLANARSDARAISDTLQSLGFQVHTKLNLNERAMKQALRTFKGDIKAGDEVLFYFAGHGVQVGGSNYLLPTDIRGESEDQVKDEAIQLQRVMDDMQDSKAKFALAVIDACRDNPFKTAGRAIGGRGLAPTSAATGQMIIFSAGNGQQALDKLGKDDRNTNSVFTRAFVKEIQTPGVSVDRILRNVRKEVVQQARTVGHDQVPALYDQAVGDFFFKP